MRIPILNRAAAAAALLALIATGAEASEPPDGTVLFETVIDLDPAGPPHDELPTDLLALPEGRLVTAGVIRDSSSAGHRIGLARLLASGDLDPEFGDGGLLPDAVPSIADVILLRGAAFDSSTGNLLLAGDEYSGSSPTAFVARLLEDGSLDSTFGAGGVRRFESPEPGSRCYVVELLLLPAGRTLVVAKHVDASGSRPALARLTVDGDLDATFDGDGYKVVPLGAGAIFPTTASRQADGRILLGTGNRLSLRAAVSRLLETGDPDPSFGDAGTREIPFTTAPSPAYLQAVRPTEDGKVLAAGDVCVFYDRFLCFDEGWGIVRLLANGQLDGAFGDGGLRTGGAHCWDETCPTYFDYGFTDAVEQGDGRILVTGVIRVSGEDSLVSAGVQRLLSDGAVDSSFGADGIAVVDFARPEGPASSLGSRIALTAEGRVGLLGESVLVPAGEVRRWAVASLSNSYLFADGFDTGSTRNWTLGEEP